jgi:hypothetical protein
MFSFKKPFGILFALLLGAGSLFAQDTTIPDQDLEKFVDAYKGMVVLNETAQQRMVAAVEAEKLSVERFNELSQAQEAPDSPAKPATPEEQKQFDAAMGQLMKVQMEVQGEMEALIVKSGLSVERYQEIAMRLQSDPELQLRIQAMLQG